MANSPLGGFADLASYRRLVDAQKAANANGLETLIQNYIGGAQQGNVMVNLPEILQQQNQDRRNKALSDQIALQLQGIQLNEAQNPNLALDRALRSKLALESTTPGTGVIQSPDVLGTLGTTPIATPGALTPEQMGLLGIREENAAAGGAPVEIPTAEVGAPITPIPTVTGAPSGFSQDLNRAIAESAMLSRAKGANTADIASERNAAFLQGLQAKKILSEEAIASKEKIEANKLAQKSIANLTPEDARALVTLDLKTNQRTNFGMGQSADRSLYLKTRATMLQEQGYTPSEVAAMQAEFIADKKALGELTAQEAKIMTFANTAELNLKRAEELSSKVDRTGVPVINRWLLAGKKKIAGDADVTAFDAAVEVAVNEAAKTLSSATGAGVTSDAARAEIRGILNSAQTPEQFAAVAQVLHQDLGNRGISYKQFKKNLIEGISGSSSASTAAPSGNSLNIGRFKVTPK